MNHSARYIGGEDRPSTPKKCSMWRSGDHSTCLSNLLDIPRKASALLFSQDMASANNACRYFIKATTFIMFTHKISLTSGYLLLILHSFTPGMRWEHILDGTAVYHWSPCPRTYMNSSLEAI